MKQILLWFIKEGYQKRLRNIMRQNKPNSGCAYRLYQEHLRHNEQNQVSLNYNISGCSGVIYRLIRKYGVIKGLIVAKKRLNKCKCASHELRKIYHDKYGNSMKFKYQNKANPKTRNQVLQGGFVDCDVPDCDCDLPDYNLSNCDVPDCQNHDAILNGCDLIMNIGQAHDATKDVFQDENISDCHLARYCLWDLIDYWCCDMIICGYDEIKERKEKQQQEHNLVSVETTGETTEIKSEMDNKEK